MAKRKLPSASESDVGPFRENKHAELERRGAVQGEADLQYGMVSGFRSGFGSTGQRFKSQLPYVREGCAHDQVDPRDFQPGKRPKGDV